MEGERAMTTLTTTFGALTSGTPFTFDTAALVGFPSTTVFTKDGPFSFTAGKTTLTLDSPKTMKVTPVATGPAFLH
jgi:hypothetical protein